MNDLDDVITRLVELGGRTIGDIHVASAESGRSVECQDDQGVWFGPRQATN